MNGEKISICFSENSGKCMQFDKMRTKNASWISSYRHFNWFMCHIHMFKTFQAFSAFKCSTSRDFPWNEKMQNESFCDIFISFSNFSHQHRRSTLTRAPERVESFSGFRQACMQIQKFPQFAETLIFRTRTIFLQLSRMWIHSFALREQERKKNRSTKQFFVATFFFYFSTPLRFFSSSIVDLELFPTNWIYCCFFLLFTFFPLRSEYSSCRSECRVRKMTSSLVIIYTTELT